MIARLVRSLLLILWITQPFLHAQNPHPSVPWTLDHLNLEGYYKHALLNGGPGVGVPPTSHFEALGLTYESIDPRDCASQREAYRNLFIGSDIDKNGMLFYPDGTNRFALMVVGGAASENNLNDDCSNLSTGTWGGGGGDFSTFLSMTENALNQSGGDHFKNFLARGGAYSGFCAGSSIMARFGLNITGYAEIPVKNAHDWRFDRIGDTLTPYLGDRTQFSDICTVGGGKLPYPNVPAGAEVLFEGTSNSEEWGRQFGAMVWSWEDDEPGYGRMVVSGAHPEDAADGFAVTAAMYSHALDGAGERPIKSEALQNGVVRVMDRETEDFEPEYTKIGDKQIHQFTFEVTDDRDRFLLLELVGARRQNGGEAYDFRLYLNKNRPALPSDHQYTGTGSLSDKTIYLENLDSLPGGTWYVGVALMTSVELEENLWGDLYYIGPTEVLNGIAYELTATWRDRPIQVCEERISNLAVGSELVENTANTITWDSTCLDTDARVTIDLQATGGARLRTLASDISAVAGRFNWNTDQAPGSYRLRVTANHDVTVQATSEVFTIVAPEPLIRVIGKGSMVNGTLYVDDCKYGSNCQSTLILSNTGTAFSLVGATVVDAAGNPGNVFRMTSPNQTNPWAMPFPAQLFLDLGARGSATLQLTYSGGSHSGASYLELQSTRGTLEYQRINLCVNCR